MSFSKTADALTVYELGEDGEAWFVENATTVQEAEHAISLWLDETVGPVTENDDQRAGSDEALDRATFTTGRWWFATGHREGEMVSDEEPPVWLTGMRVS